MSKRARVVAVEPPSQAVFMRAAYRHGDVEAHRPVYVSQHASSFVPGHDRPKREAECLMKVTTDVSKSMGYTPGSAEPPSFLGVVYSETLAETAGAVPVVAVAVLGAVTIIDEVFSNRGDCTPGQFVHVDSRGELSLSRTRLPAAGSRALIGMLLEVGYHNDGRVLL